MWDILKISLFSAVEVMVLEKQSNFYVFFLLDNYDS